MICVGSEMTGLRMPAKYVDLSIDEMEYDGGLFNFAFSAITTAIGVGCTIIGHATNNKTLVNVGNVCTFIGAISTGIGLAAGVGTAMAGTMTTVQGLNFAFNSSLGLGFTLAGFVTLFGK